MNLPKGLVRRLLGVFPFSLFYLLISAAKRELQLRRGHVQVRAGKFDEAGAALPCSVLIWLDRAAADIQETHFDVCLKLPNDADANLHEVFSVLLTSPRLRSAGLYWDSASLADDRRLWQGNGSESMVTALRWDDVGSLSYERLHEFFQVTHAGIAVPIAATRDAETLLKRRARRSYAVCLNVPAKFRSLADAIMSARQDVRFFDLSDYGVPSAEIANGESLYDYGLTLHERLALVQAVDAYVGSFDTLGCAALASGRTAVLLGDGQGVKPDRIDRDDRAVWFPNSLEATTPAGDVLEFLSRRLRRAES